MRKLAVAHPDAGGEVPHATILNDAFKALSDPLTRAEALLCAMRAPTSDGRALPDGFLLHMMELRERLDASLGDAAVLAELAREGERMHLDASTRISDAFSDAGEVGLSTASAQVVREGINVLRAVGRMREQVEHATTEAMHDLGE